MKNEYVIDGDMVLIKIRRKDQWMECIIDLDDLERAKSFEGRWYAKFDPTVDSCYVTAYYREDGKDKLMPLHRWLMKPPKNMVVDHINRNPLDNRKQNLRVITTAQNAQNKSPAKKNKSGARGVFWEERLRKWRAYASLNKKRYHLGVFENFEDADRAAKEFRAKHMPYSQEARDKQLLLY